MRWRSSLLAGVLAVASVVRIGAASDLRVLDAAKSRDVAAVRAMLAAGANVNGAQGDGATALHWAAHWDDLVTVDLLIRAGAAVNSADRHGVTPLWLACLNGSAAMVGRLLAAGADANAAHSSGETALMTAARTGNADVVKLLLAGGARVNAAERLRGQTALMWAVAQRHADVVRLLIENGADLHARSRTWSQVMTTGGEDMRFVSELEQGGYTPLLFAARQGDLESTRVLLAAGANVNDTAAAGTSALVVAAHSGQGALAALLLDHGADPNAAGAGYTALHAAVVRGDLALTKAVLAHGADPNARLLKGTPERRGSHDFSLAGNLIGATPFWLAAKLAEPAIMRVLAAAGADPRVAMKNGTTALMVAIYLGEPALAGGISDRRGQPLSPLQLTTRSDAEDERISLETVKAAVELGADVEAMNAAGHTAEFLAHTKGMSTVAQFLAASAAASAQTKNQ
jgi:ankyrin repeat protein